MTEQTPLQAALAEAGRNLAKSFADAGSSVIAQLALSAIMSGNLDSARGILEPLDEAQRSKIGDAASTLLGLADPVFAASTSVHDLPVPGGDTVTARAMVAAGILAYALRGRPGDVARHLDDQGADDLLWLRRGVTAVLTAIDARLPQDRPQP